MESPEENKDKVVKPEENRKTEKKKIPSWIWWALGAIALIAITTFALSRKYDEKKVTEKPKTEQQPGSGNQQPGPGTQPTQPGTQQPTQPVTQIDLPASMGEYNWADVNQPMLTKALTTTPDLNGETVLLVYIVKGHPSGQDMVWFQTDQGGKVRNTMCERKYTKL